jgi:hypothetical protein
MNKTIRIEDALKILELPTTLFLPVTHANSPQKAQEELESFKNIIKKQKKVLAKKYHPDVYDGDEERIKQINNIIDFINVMRIVVRPPPTIIYHHVFTSNYNSATTSTFYNDSTTTDFW